MKNITKVIAIIAVLGVGVAFAASAFAAKPSGNTRPGWGFGDKNHVHTGPPGHSVHPNK